MRRDYYAVLGIAATAGPREVRRAYQRLARQYSPDVNFWDERARELFDEIAEAFRVLGDPTARSMYDRFEDVAGADDAVGAGRRGGRRRDSRWRRFRGSDPHGRRGECWPVRRAAWRFDREHAGA